MTKNRRIEGVVDVEADCKQAVQSPSLEATFANERLSEEGSENDQMTKEEREIVVLLGDVWKRFKKLPSQHAKEKHRFADAIHIAQVIVLARPAVRGNVDLVEDGE